ncbi:hypothetical protein GYMLUDRAFT_644232 [Collybiopsis luxurians FD-317 M1]|nr:hypothetical protein GYMLUDRAFT_644232 [Collybiopsis luxurians FD-317 M1]
MQRTHWGTLERPLRKDPLCVSSGLSDQDSTGPIWLAAHFSDESGEGVRPFRITLEPDTEMAFYLPEAPKYESFVSEPIFMDFLVVGGSAARGIGSSTSIFRSKRRVIMYNIHMGSDRDLHVDAACVDLPKLSECCCFDPFVGMVHLSDSDMVEVWDLS